MGNELWVISGKGQVKLGRLIPINRLETGMVRFEGQTVSPDDSVVKIERNIFQYSDIKKEAIEFGKIVRILSSDEFNVLRIDPHNAETFMEANKYERKFLEGITIEEHNDIEKDRQGTKARRTI